MNKLHLSILALITAFGPTTAFVQTNNQPTTGKPPITIVTDPSWDVSERKTQFGEYPLSAELQPSASSPLWGGTRRAVIAEHNERSKIVPGAMPIWRNREADGDGEAYQFRKNVSLGADPIRKVTLEINSDDVSRIYINKRLVSVPGRDGRLKDGWDDYYTLRSVSSFMYDRLYPYDVTDYFFTNVTNSIVIEALSLAFDGSHAYVSAKILIEFDPLPAPQAPTPPVAAPLKSRPLASKPPAKTPQPTAVQPAAADKTVFEAGRDPEISALRVGSVLELGHVFFKADDYRLDTASYRTLDALAAFMKRHPTLKIEVGGHTNLRPNERFAAGLSANRARAVARYLTDNGVGADRVSYKGYGKSQPRIKAISKDADRANQRVEVKVLGK